MRILVAQTIYPGDLVLTLPLLQHLHESYQGATLDLLVARGMEDLVSSHPAVSNVLTYDKSGAQKGWTGTVTLANVLKSKDYSVALVLPGSVRTCIAVWLARIPRRIGTDQSSGMMLFADVVKFPDAMSSSPNAWLVLPAERLWNAMTGRNSVVSSLFTDVVKLDRRKNAIERHLQLLEPLGISVKKEFSRPRLYPRSEDINAIDAIVTVRPENTMIALAPGSTWATKRWGVQRFADLAQAILNSGMDVVIVGGPEDRELGQHIAAILPSGRAMNLCGNLSFLESAELLRRCAALVTNDTAVMHIAAAMGTPCVAIFGPTATEFGFTPAGTDHMILQKTGLPCRPCTPHGGMVCPVGTHECMTAITIEEVLMAVNNVVGKKRVEG